MVWTKCKSWLSRQSNKISVWWSHKISTKQSLPVLTVEQSREKGKLLLKEIALGWKPPARKSWKDPDPAAVAVLGDHPAIAADVRRSGLPCLTIWNGKINKRLTKADQHQCQVAVFSGLVENTFVVKDLWTGRQKEVEEHQVLLEIAEVLENGYYDPNETLEEFIQKLDS